MGAVGQVVAGRLGGEWRRLVRRHGWTVGVWGLLVLLLLWYAALIPRFGPFAIASIAKNSLPTAYLAVSQAVVVIAGGIDLAVGSMMVLANCVSALLMEGQSFGTTVLIAVGVVAGATLLNALVGWVIVTSRIPDIIVTLATLFVFGGAALMVLPSPGGGTSGGLRFVFTGSTSGVGSNYWPSLVALAVPLAVLAAWLGRTRTGLSLYAAGSDPNAAYLSGLNTRRAKVLAYAIGGAFAALAGLAVTAITATGDPKFANAANGTLNSVAAVVLGGVALTGGVGSVIGAVAAGVVLFILKPILTAMAIDPNTAQVIQGLLIIGVMMVAGLLELRRRRAG
ncbi:MAG TPA: ABC transporter permease [Actinomycetota bacterium]|nr:ABC transporter permease [Actinomycetota bacterium]